MMTRIPVKNAQGVYLGKWFDLDRATRYAEDSWWDGSNWISKATGCQWDHEEVVRTASGRWIMHEWSNRDRSPDQWYEITQGTAVQWLIANGHAEVVESLDAQALANLEV